MNKQIDNFVLNYCKVSLIQVFAPKVNIILAIIKIILCNFSEFMECAKKVFFERILDKNKTCLANLL